MDAGRQHSPATAVKLVDKGSILLCTGLSTELAGGNVTKSDGDKHGSVATFSCDDGFLLTGTASINCTAPSGPAPWPSPAQEPVCRGTLLGVVENVVQTRHLYWCHAYPK